MYNFIVYCLSKAIIQDRLITGYKMGETIGITPTFLLQNKDIANFLSQHLSIDRELGKSRKIEKGFIDITQGEKDGFGQGFALDLFRNKDIFPNAGKGLPTLPVSAFKNNDISPNINPSLKPDNLFNKFSFFPTQKGKDSFINLRFSNVFSNARNQPGGEKFIDINTASFLQNNKELVNFFNENSTLLTSLINGDIKNRKDVEDIVVDFVADKLASKSVALKDFLSSHFVLSKFAALDLGGIISLINNNSSIEKAFTADATFAKEIIKDQIFDKASSLFPKSEELTRLFFEKNLIAAVFLLDKPGEVARIKNEQLEGEKTFVKRADTIEGLFKSELVDIAFDQFGLGSVLSKSFLNTNLEFTTIAVGDILTNKSGLTLAQFLKENRELLPVLDPVEIDKIFISFQAETASRKFPDNFPIDKEFLESNFNLAFVINLSPGFVDALKEDKEAIERFIKNNLQRDSDSKSRDIFSRINLALDAFLSGFVTREKTGTNLDLTI